MKLALNAKSTSVTNLTGIHCCQKFILNVTYAFKFFSAKITLPPQNNKSAIFGKKLFYYFSVPKKTIHIFHHHHFLQTFFPALGPRQALRAHTHTPTYFKPALPTRRTPHDDVISSSRPILSLANRNPVRLATAARRPPFFITRE